MIHHTHRNVTDVFLRHVLAVKLIELRRVSQKNKFSIQDEYWCGVRAGMDFLAAGWQEEKEKQNETN